jgi:phosphoribosylformimino-5-aminoimidazole carboxamide ribotide isomerase
MKMVLAPGIARARLAMRIIPVLDLRGGFAVHARSGPRAHYPHVASVLHPSPDPVALAEAFRRKLGLRELYVADLDAIGGGATNLAMLERLESATTSLWIDAGVVEAREALALSHLARARIVLGLESIGGPAEVKRVVEALGPDRVIFSVDMRRGRLLVNTGARVKWPALAADPAAVVAGVSVLGVRTMLLLELARVGTSRGIESWAVPLLARLRARAPDAEWFVGGGLRSSDELDALERGGCDGVLVASALHSGVIDAKEAARWTTRRGSALPPGAAESP